MDEQAKAYWDVVDPLVERINIYDGSQAFLASISPVPRGVALVFAADFCLNEIQNGGFLQFFANSTGVLAPEAVEGFAVIGMPYLAAVVGSVISRLGEPYPRDRRERARALLTASGHDEQAIDAILYGSDDRFAALRKATEPLDFDTSDREVYRLANNESGGFDAAKERYVEQLPILK